MMFKKPQTNSELTFHVKWSYSIYVVRNKITQAGKTLPVFHQAFISEDIKDQIF